jgi:molybdopterin-containing oxidoreductase family membrane subunit
LLVLLLQAADRLNSRSALPGALDLLVRALRLAVWAHVLLIGVEAFVHFYSPSEHGLAFRYQFFGLAGQDRMVPWNWSGLVLILFAMAVLTVPAWCSRRLWLNLACGAAALSAWIDKSMGLIWPGFVPSPMGEVVEYLPSWDEIVTSAGILAVGLIVFTISLKVSYAAEEPRELSLRR